jgi:hypothetical protein
MQIFFLQMLITSTLFANDYCTSWWKNLMLKPAEPRTKEVSFASLEPSQDPILELAALLAPKMFSQTAVDFMSSLDSTEKSSVIARIESFCTKYQNPHDQTLSLKYQFELFFLLRRTILDTPPNRDEWIDSPRLCHVILAALRAL